MDAYRNPLLVNKAKINGIRTSSLDIRTSIDKNLKSSLMLFSVSPFTNNSMTITNKDSNLQEIIHRMSMGKRFPVAIHDLKGEVKEIIQIFGESNDPQFTDFTKKFYKIFNIPICKLIIQVDDKGVILNHCEPATKKDIDWDLVHKKVKYINL